MGTLAYYTCEPGKIQSGARSAICLESGYWEFVGDSTRCTAQTGEKINNSTKF